MKYVRIPFTSENVTVHSVPDSFHRSYLEEILYCGKRIEQYLPMAYVPGVNTTSLRSLAATAPAMTLTMSPGESGDYQSSYFPHPVMPVSVQVPEGDLDIVRSWLGRGTSGTQVVSETFGRRMTSAVIGGMRNYFGDMTRLGLFTRPFRLGLALRLVNGRHLPLVSPRLVVPNASAPLMIAHGPSLNGQTLSSVTEIVNTPAQVHVSLPPFTLPGELGTQVTHLDVIATAQADVLGGDEAVIGLRNYQYAGETLLGWYYRSLGEDEVRRRAEADESFRVIASLPIGEAVQGVSRWRVPGDGNDLVHWQELDEYDQEEYVEDTDTPVVPDDPAPLTRRVLLETIPLHFGYPGLRKNVLSLNLNGIFQRRRRTNVTSDKDLTVALYGAWHRGEWRLVHAFHGGNTSGRIGVFMPWYRLVILAPRSAVIDGLECFLHMK